MFNFINQLGLTKPLAVLAAALICCSLLVSHAQSASLHTWTGGAGTQFWSNSSNWDAGALHSGVNIEFDNYGLGADKLVRNDYSGLTLGGLYFTGTSDYSYMLSGNRIALRDGILVQTFDPTLQIINAPILAKDDLVIRAENSSSLLLTKNLAMGSHDLALETELLAFIFLDGNVVSRSNTQVTGNGSGVFLLSGGRIDKQVTVSKQGSFGGSGHIDEIFVKRSGSLLPTGCMSTSSLRLEGDLKVHLRGSKPCSKHGRLDVRGTVRLNEADLSITVDEDFTPKRGSKFTLIKNAGKDAIKGRLKDYKEGASIYADGFSWKLSYKGGTGNDLTITRK